jgi:hypothetical protein
MARRINLDSRGVAKLLQSTEMHRATQDAAERVADNVRAQGIKVGDKDGGPREKDMPVEVEMTTTDRAHAWVTIAHPSGQAVQSKHGALTKAAGQAGLDVSERKR